MSSAHTLLRSSSRTRLPALTDSGRRTKIESFSDDDDDHNESIVVDEDDSSDVLVMSESKTSTTGDSLEFRSVPRHTNELVVEYQHGKHLPCMHSDLADPYVTLRFFFDNQESRLVRRFLLQYRASPAAEAAATASTPRSERRKSMHFKLNKTLKRKGKKVKPPTAGGVDKAETIDEEIALGPYKAQLELVRAEIERILDHFEETVEKFSTALCMLARIDNKHLRHEINVLSTFAILDDSIGNNSLLEELKLCDNRNFYKIGEAALSARIHAITLLQGYNSVVAAERLARISSGAHIWLTKKLGAATRNILPLVWELEPETCKQLSETDMKRKNDARMHSVPYIMIGLLELMTLPRERDTIITELLKEFV